jgi:hypothetical protein
MSCAPETASSETPDSIHVCPHVQARAINMQARLCACQRTRARGQRATRRPFSGCPQRPESEMVAVLFRWKFYFYIIRWLMSRRVAHAASNLVMPACSGRKKRRFMLAKHGVIVIEAAGAPPRSTVQLVGQDVRCTGNATRRKALLTN